MRLGDCVLAVLSRLIRGIRRRFGGKFVEHFAEAGGDRLRRDDRLGPLTALVSHHEGAIGREPDRSCRANGLSVGLGTAVGELQSPMTRRFSGGVALRQDETVVLY